MKNKFSRKQKIVLEILRWSSLKRDLNTGKFYYSVPATIRRNCKMLVSQKELKKLVDLNLIMSNTNVRTNELSYNLTKHGRITIISLGHFTHS